MNFLNLTDTSIPLETVKEKLTSYCSTPWNQVGCRFMHSLHTQKKYVHILLLFLSYVCPPVCLYCTLMVTFELLEQVTQQHPDVKVKYLAEYCFSGTYILTLLTEGYNFTSESYSNIKFIKKVSRSASIYFLSHTAQSHAPNYYKSYPLGY